MRGARALQVELEVIERRGHAVTRGDAAGDLIFDGADAGEAVGIGGELVGERDQIVGALVAVEVGLIVILRRRIVDVVRISLRANVVSCGGFTVSDGVI